MLEFKIAQFLLVTSVIKIAQQSQNICGFLNKNLSPTNLKITQSGHTIVKPALGFSGQHTYLKL